MTTRETTGSFKRSLNLFDATSIVAGAMIGSGIFIVSSHIAKDVQSVGLLLLVWFLAGLMSILGGLSYGEFAASWPEAGGQYIYIRKVWGRLAGFVYGWTQFLVIQTGIIAAVSVAFAKFAGVLFPVISPSVHLIKILSFSVSTQQAVAIAILMILTAINVKGVRSGAITQNIFTVAKIIALMGIIACGLFFGINSHMVTSNFTGMFAMPHINGMSVFSAVAVAMVGAIFAADSWNSVTFIAGEIKKPERNLPLSMFLGTVTVTMLYLLTNLVYLFVLPVSGIANAKNNIVGTVFMQALFGGAGSAIMAVIILISAFGCLNGMILTGARVYYAMAKDGLFFRKLAVLGEKSNAPENSLYLQCFWASVLIMSGSYIQLLEYAICAALIFYTLTISGIIHARRKFPDIHRPYKVIGYPYVPVAYCVLALTVIINLFIYRSHTTLPGLFIIMSGLPVYLFWKKGKESQEPIQNPKNSLKKQYEEKKEEESKEKETALIL
jgi:basic amino acid/polyamine antiporter, APA family